MAIARNGGDESASLGQSFHAKINIAANSPRLARLLDTVVTTLPNRLCAGDDGHVSTTQADHPLLLNALSRRASRKARALMEAHVLHGADNLISELELRGMWLAQKPK
jgi:DNA-binding GntR family transcriptional regulator